MEANAKLITALDADVTSPRRRSNHCESIVRDESVNSPWPVKRRHPNPMLITASPTTEPIGPTRLRPVSVEARPRTATKATTREP